MSDITYLCHVRQVCELVEGLFGLLGCWVAGLLGCRFIRLTGCCLAGGPPGLPGCRIGEPCPRLGRVSLSVWAKICHMSSWRGTRRLEGCAGLRVKVIYTHDCQSASWSIGSFAFVSNRTCFNRSTLQGVYVCACVRSGGWDIPLENLVLFVALVVADNAL